MNIGIYFQLSLVILDDAFYHSLIRIIACGGCCGFGSGKVFNSQQAGFLGNQFFRGGEAAAVTECLAHIGFHDVPVIFGTIIPGAVPLKGQVLK